MDIKKFQQDHGLTSNEVVAAMRTQYPKYDKHIHSRVMHPDVYGLKLVKEAERLIEGIFALAPCAPTRDAKRKNPYKLSFRVNKSKLDQLQLAQTRNGYDTMQGFLTFIVFSWLEAQNEGES